MFLGQIGRPLRTRRSGGYDSSPIDAKVVVGARLNTLLQEAVATSNARVLAAGIPTVGKHRITGRPKVAPSFNRGKMTWQINPSTSTLVSTTAGS